ncbi:pilus assembly protein Flp/PilA [Devosia enhydra]|uniref:Pilus assembly protein Flp/PilA n=1 Tax=Devosia enhydra TaxID=665118 RepID=A0A1K2I0Q9_9HYPH|nr:Flp family type IVb pilin [Devosia enhydra]SFZ85787.1 pilus assembly protein Flp/PilA [Devosia enhydra]
MVQVVRRFLRDERGATAIEYGLLGILVGVGAIVAFTTLGDNLSLMFGTSEGGISAAMQNSLTANAEAMGGGQ